MEYLCISSPQSESEISTTEAAIYCQKADMALQSGADVEDIRFLLILAREYIQKALSQEAAERKCFDLIYSALPDRT